MVHLCEVMICLLYIYVDGITEACCIQIYYSISMQCVIAPNVAIKNNECFLDDMHDLTCGLFSVILRWYG